MTQKKSEKWNALPRAVRWPLRLTWGGMLAEQLARAFWPLVTLVLFVLAALMMGFYEWANPEVLWAAIIGALLLASAGLIYGVRRFRWPRRAAAIARLDQSMAGRPLSAVMDHQVVGGRDPQSRSVWQAHLERMKQRASGARAVPGDLKVARFDPFGLRLLAALAFVMAVLFGSVWKIGAAAGLGPEANAVVEDAIWEGWAEPPRYTGRPTLYLNDIKEGSLELPAGTLITLRFYGSVGALSVEETLSARGVEEKKPADPAQEFTAIKGGKLAINGKGGRAWDVAVLPDNAPSIQLSGDPSVSALGETTLPFSAQDDYGVEDGEARIKLDLDSVERRYGLAFVPEDRPELLVALPMPVAGKRDQIEENLIEDFSKHPWANLPVTVQLVAIDAAEQQGQTAPKQITLPGRRFFDPRAAAVIEMRRDLLWSKQNAPRVAQVLRAVAHLPETAFRKETSALKLQRLIDRLELNVRFGLKDEAQDDIAEDLWSLAIELEEGVLADALERMRRAQERLNEAIKNGAAKEEIAELMDELRRATEEYMRQLQRQQAQENERQGEEPQGETMQMTQDDLQRMMDRIQELMEQGRMAEAEEALRQFQEMMENMRVTQGGQGSGSNSPGEKAMEELSDTLRDQEGLSDEAFRDLQEQFNPNSNAGESEGNEGRSGNKGRGQSHEGQGNEQAGDEQGQGQGANEQGDENSEKGAPSGRQDAEKSLADRQRALRRELERQRQNLPGQGTPEGDAAGDALDRAGDAMNDAEQALRNRDLEKAIDDQARAMNELREGMRELGEAMAMNETNEGQGQSQSRQRSRAQSDPLGRERGGGNTSESANEIAEGGERSARARRLLDEIRRRSGEKSRPEAERDYLKRLLERF